MSQISWEDSPWNELSLVTDEEVISFSNAKYYVFSDSVLCLGKVNQNPASNTVWEEQLGWFKDSPQYKNLDTIDGEPMEFDWNVLFWLKPFWLKSFCWLKPLQIQRGLFVSSPRLFMGRNRKFVLEDELQQAVWRSILRGPRPPSVKWDKTTPATKSGVSKQAARQWEETRGEDEATRSDFDTASSFPLQRRRWLLRAVEW